MYAILYKVGYLSKLAPSGGSVQFDLAAPNQNASSTSVDVTTLEYCSQDPHSATRTAKAYPCVWFDGLQTRIIQGDSILVTTRVTGTIQKRTACGETCTELWTPPLATKLTQSNTFFVADPENYEFKILHSVQQTAIGTKQGGEGGSMSICDSCRLTFVCSLSCVLFFDLWVPYCVMLGAVCRHFIYRSVRSPYSGISDTTSLSLHPAHNRAPFLCHPSSFRIRPHITLL